MFDLNEVDSRGFDPEGNSELDDILQLLKSAAKIPKVQRICALVRLPYWGYENMTIPTSVNYIVNGCSYIGKEPAIFFSKINHYILDAGLHPFLPHDTLASASDLYPFNLE